jgi:hypothetical protein
MHGLQQNLLGWKMEKPEGLVKDIICSDNSQGA